MVIFLVQEKIKINHTDKLGGVSSLMNACGYDHLEVVQYLIKVGCDVE